MTDHSELGQMYRPKGLDKDDVHTALRVEGSVYAAAKKLDVTRQTVYDYMERYGWPNPKTGKVPGSDDG